MFIAGMVVGACLGALLIALLTASKGGGDND